MNSSSKSYTPHKSASNSSPESKSPEVQLKKAQLILQEYFSCSEIEVCKFCILVMLTRLGTVCNKVLTF